MFSHNISLEVSLRPYFEHNGEKTQHLLVCFTHSNTKVYHFSLGLQKKYVIDRKCMHMCVWFDQLLC